MFVSYLLEVVSYFKQFDIIRAFDTYIGQHRLLYITYDIVQPFSKSFQIILLDLSRMKKLMDMLESVCGIVQNCI